MEVAAEEEEEVGGEEEEEDIEEDEIEGIGEGRMVEGEEKGFRGRGRYH